MSVTPEKSYVPRIAHIDMDAFFVAIERLERPDLEGVPVVVGGLSGRGVVCSASYEARSFGVHSGMPMSRARLLCPQAAFIGTTSGKYSAASARVREVLADFSPDVDFTSVDEGYIDLTGTQRLLGEPLAVARRMQEAVLAATGCHGSIGVAGTRLCAKVASKFSKPAGVIEVAPGAEEAFLAPLPLGLLPGAGGSLGERLAEFGITTIGQLARVGERFLERTFGAAGAGLYQRAVGGRRGFRPSSFGHRPGAPRKSVSHERTFREDTTDRDFLERVIFRLSERCCRTLRDEGLVGRCVTLKLRLADWRAGLYERERYTAFGPGDVLFYRHDTWHRGTPMNPGALRLVQNLTYRRAECEWISTLHVGWAWQAYRRDKYLERLISRASLDQRAVLGFPQPGSDYWTEGTIAAVEARHGVFGMDMTPYRAALASRQGGGP